MTIHIKDYFIKQNPIRLRVMQMEALFCSKCEEKIIDENVPCKFCGTLPKKTEGVSPNQTKTAKPQKSKLLILIICVIIVFIIAIIFLR
jgi:uncharacterized membrane protein YvbJ